MVKIALKLIRVFIGFYLSVTVSIQGPPGPAGPIGPPGFKVTSILSIFPFMFFYFYPISIFPVWVSVMLNHAVEKKILYEIKKFE